MRDIQAGTATRYGRAKNFWILLALMFFTACASSVPPSNVNAKSNARLTPSSRVTRDLTQLPEPKTKIAVAVYGFRDQTGQFKPSPESTYSTSVTQGSASMLIKALKDSGWYIPVEREGLQNLLTERKIVRAIEAPGDKGKPLINLPNLMPASLIIEGGVIAYESNVRTGGKGANYLGIGASTQYRVDQVTVSLRNIDIRTGQVLNSVSVTKTIYSYQFSASLYKFTSYQHLLQGETGYTSNEPAQLAVREAIESAVVHMTVQGVRDRFLELKEPQQIFSPIIQTYLAENVSNLSEDGSVDDTPITMRPIAIENQVPPVQPLLPANSEASVPVGNLAKPQVLKPSVAMVTTPVVAAVPSSPVLVSSPAAQAAVSEKQAATKALPNESNPVTLTNNVATAPLPLIQQPKVQTPDAQKQGSSAKQVPVLSDDIFKQYWRTQ